MGMIKVTSEDLANVATQLGQVSVDIDGQLTSMAGQVQGLVANDWQGAASGQFQSLWDEWHRSAASLREALDGISSLLRNASEAYTSTEEQITTSMSQR